MFEINVKLNILLPVLVELAHTLHGYAGNEVSPIVSSGDHLSRLKNTFRSQSQLSHQ